MRIGLPQVAKVSHEARAACLKEYI